MDYLISELTTERREGTHYQRNANQDHSEVPFHASQNGCDERVWRKGNPLTLLVGMQTSTATMENSVEIP